MFDFRRILDYSNKNPWLYAVYVVLVGLPLVLIITFCCSGSSERPGLFLKTLEQTIQVLISDSKSSLNDPKKTDDPQEDDEEEDGENEGAAGDEEEGGEGEEGDEEGEESAGQEEEGEEEEEEEDDEPPTTRSQARKRRPRKD